MKLRLHTTHDQDGYLLALQEAWTKRLGYEVSCSQLLRWIIDRCKTADNWSPAPRMLGLKLSDVIRQAEAKGISGDQRRSAKSSIDSDLGSPVGPGAGLESR